MVINSTWISLPRLITNLSLFTFSRGEMNTWTFATSSCESSATKLLLVLLLFFAMQNYVLPVEYIYIYIYVWLCFTCHRLLTIIIIAHYNMLESKAIISDVCAKPHLWPTEFIGLLFFVYLFVLDTPSYSILRVRCCWSVIISM